MGTAKRPEAFGPWPILIIAGCFLIGGVLGCLLGTFGGSADIGEVEQYLREFLVLARAHEVSWSVPAVIWNRGRWLLFCGLFALTAAGVGILPLLVGLRGFLAAFGISCFVRVFGAVGLVPAIVVIGIPALLWAPGFFLLGVLCLRCSAIALRKEERILKFGGAVRVFCLSVVFLVLCVIFECVLLPRLLSAAAMILK